MKKKEVHAWKGIDQVLPKAPPSSSRPLLRSCASRSLHILCALHLSWWLTISRRKFELPSTKDVRISGISLHHFRQYVQNIMLFCSSNCSQLNWSSQLGLNLPPLRLVTVVPPWAGRCWGLEERVTVSWRSVLSGNRATICRRLVLSCTELQPCWVSRYICRVLLTVDGSEVGGQGLFGCTSDSLWECCGCCCWCGKPISGGKWGWCCVCCGIVPCLVSHPTVFC